MHVCWLPGYIIIIYVYEASHARVGDPTTIYISSSLVLMTKHLMAAAYNGVCNDVQHTSEITRHVSQRRM